MAALGDDIVRAVTCDRVREATVRDSTLPRLMEMVTEGVTDNKEAWMGELREYYKPKIQPTNQKSKINFNIGQQLDALRRQQAQNQQFVSKSSTL